MNDTAAGCGCLIALIVGIVLFVGGCNAIISDDGPVYDDEMCDALWGRDGIYEWEYNANC